MDERDVPYIAFESALSREERHVKRLVTVIIVLLICWFLTIASFLYYESLPVEEYSIQNDDGNANYIGNDLNGDLYNGENNSEETDEQKAP